MEAGPTTPQGDTGAPFAAGEPPRIRSQLLLLQVLGQEASFCLQKEEGGLGGTARACPGRGGAGMGPGMFGSPVYTAPTGWSDADSDSDADGEGAGEAPWPPPWPPPGGLRGFRLSLAAEAVAAEEEEEDGVGAGGKASGPAAGGGAVPAGAGREAWPARGVEDLPLEELERALRREAGAAGVRRRAAEGRARARCAAEHRRSARVLGEELANVRDEEVRSPGGGVGAPLSSSVLLPRQGQGSLPPRRGRRGDEIAIPPPSAPRPVR